MSATSQAHREETMITTEQDALEAVSKDGRSLKCVPPALRWVPERFRTDALKMTTKGE